MQLVKDPEELPDGSHSVALYGTWPEAARQMGGFLRGAQSRRQAALVVSCDDQRLGLYRHELARRAPSMVGSLRKIPGLHTQRTPDGLRPLPEILEFAAAHPEGATMCGDTLPGFLDRRTLPEILSYEGWFDRLRPYQHRGLCPYDLSRIPVDRAADALAQLAAVHTHGVLSVDADPAVRLLQLLVLPHVENPPDEQLVWLARAVDHGFVSEDRTGGDVALTPRGENLALALRGLARYARSATAAAEARRSGPRAPAPTAPV
jgi:hypothetical protein